MNKYISSLMRLGVMICLIFPVIACWILSFINPAFFDAFPLLLILIGAGIALIFIVGITLIFLLFGLGGSQDSRMSYVIQRMTSNKVFIIVIMLTVVSFVLLRLLSWQMQPQWEPEKKSSLLILGLDGATWDIMNPMIEEGKLPHLKQLRDRGSFGRLQSLDPMDSPVLWASIATGRPPGEHGVTGFFSTRDDLSAVRFWDLCKSRHIRVGLCSWLLTWPLRDPFTFVIPTWMAQTPETYPSEYTCFQEIALEQGVNGEKISPGKVLTNCFYQGARLQSLQQQAIFYWKDCLGLTEESRLAAKSMADVSLRTDMFLSLLGRYQPQVAAFTLYGTDKLGHRFWHYMNSEPFDDVDSLKQAKYGDVIPNYYAEADKAFGRILAACPEDTTVMVLSDHGMKADSAFPRQFFFHVDAWMEIADGYGKVRPSFINRRLILEPLIEKEDELNRITEFFESVMFKENDEQVFSVSQDEEGHYVVRTNFSLTWNPASPLLENDHLIIQGETYLTSDFFFYRTFSGTHDPEGIFILSGSGIGSNTELEDIDLLDIAPTVMAMLDLPISRELAGRVMSEAFTKPVSPNYVDEYPPLPQWDDIDVERSDAYMERLRSVGYIE